jgi:hypothetical protein
MSDIPTLQVQFRYTLWDRIRCGLVMSFQTIPSALWFLAFPAMGLALLGVNLYYGTPIGLGTAGLIALCLLFIPLRFTYAALRAHFFGAHKNRPFNYQFGDFGLRAYNETEELTQSWKAISKVKLQGGFLMLFVSPRYAHCLPYRQLSELGAADQVAALARAHGVRVHGI